MEIKDVENLLSVSRSNIRFYEKQGLITPERRKNNYRDYNEEDITALKRIIILRKMGFTIEEIQLIQKGELPFSEAISDTKMRLETEIEQLNGALKSINKLSDDCSSFEEMDIDIYWDNIHNSEASGEKFIDICKDWLEIELNSLDTMWKYAFFHDFKKSRVKHGVLKACGILLLICTVRGISNVVIWQESFWSGFLYPWCIALAASLISLPLFLLSKKAPKIASIVSSFLLMLIFAFFALIVLFILFSLLYGIFV